MKSLKPGLINEIRESLEDGLWDSYMVFLEDGASEPEEKEVTEELDGSNLMFSWKDGKLISAYVEKEVIEEIPEPEPEVVHEYVQELKATETQNRSRESEFDYTAQRDRIADHVQYTKQTQYILREKFEKEDLLREEESAPDDFNADSSLYTTVKDGSIVAKRWF